MTYNKINKINNGVLGFFPFSDDFQQLIDGAVSVEYVERVSSLGKALLDTIGDGSGLSGYTLARHVNVVLYLQAVVMKCGVSVAMMPYATTMRSVGLAADCMRANWLASMKDEHIPVVNPSEATSGLIVDAVASMVRDYHVDMVLSNESLLAFPAFKTIKVRELDQILVESDTPTSKDLCEFKTDLRVFMSSEISSWAARVYKPHLLMGGLEDVRVAISHDQQVNAHDSIYRTHSFDVLVTWLWLWVWRDKLPGDACYLKTVPPAARPVVFDKLNVKPSTLAVRQLLKGLGRWTDTVAVVELVSERMWHVVSCGLLPDSVPDDHYLGAEANSSTLFAKLLVDDFMSKHKRSLLPAGYVTHGATPEERSALSDISHRLYNQLDESPSPRSSRMGSAPAVIREMPVETLTDAQYRSYKVILNRISDGSHIPESSYSRLGRWSKYKLPDSQGLSVHIFGGYKSEADDGNSRWSVVDSLPGWTSYVRTIKPGSQVNVSFIDEGGGDDIRLDCSGEGQINFGGVRIPIYDNVVWFSVSFVANVTATSEVSMRISVPDLGKSMAIGPDIRRYLRVEGYSVVVRSFGVPKSSNCLRLSLVRSIADRAVGCRLYTSRHKLPAGSTKLEFGLVYSDKPFRLLLRSDPPEALSYISLSGVRVYPITRDYLSVIYTQSNTTFKVEMASTAVVKFSILQVVDPLLFDTIAVSESGQVH